jgi:long-chain acyl-CoA synthetase
MRVKNNLARVSRMAKKCNIKEKNLLWLKKYPAGLTWDLAIPSQPLYKLLDDAVEQFSENNCIDFLGKKYTYRDIGDLVDKTAKGLQKSGVKKHTRVGIFMPNTPYYIIFYFAILKAGGIVVNFNPLYVAPEIRNQINDSGTEIMITLDLHVLFVKVYEQLHETSLKKVIICPFRAILPFPKNILFSLFKKREQAKIPSDPDIILFDSLIQNDGTLQYHPVVPEKDIAVIQYTGGTTGIPKGAMLSHQNVYSNALQCAHWFSPSVELGHEKILASLPFFHVFAMTVVMNLSLRVGGEIVMMFPRFTVEETIKLINKHKITCLPAVPTIYTLINTYKNNARYNLRSLKACICGGAPLPLEVKKEFERLTSATLIEGYGLSEASPVVSANPLQNKSKPGSIGFPFPQTYIKIMSLKDKTREVPLGEKGELAVQGPQVMLGYWNRPKETEDVIQNGLLYTGDVGYMDEDGYVFLVDRIKDVVIVNGYNVYPRIVEEAIYQHPSVEEVTVISTPDLQRGEAVKAFVKLRSGMPLKAEELHIFLQNKLSPIEMPRQIEFRDSLPKSMIGKLSKKELIAEEKTKF